MKLREYLEQNNLSEIAQQYLDSSNDLYKKLEINVMDFDITNNRISINAVPPLWFQAHEKIVHGGLIATYIDTIAGVHAMINATGEGKIAFTKTLTVEYLAPMIVGKEYKIISEFEGKVYKCLISRDDFLVAEATIIFAFK
jgi:acyl-coenzyme A thioesterase PaaI-like protein